MGDRANIFVKDQGLNSGVFLYTHWGGSELPKVLQEALQRRERWDDSQYLTRVIFCEMVKGSEMSSTGYGISAVVMDGSSRVLTVNTDDETVSYAGQSWSFEEYCKLENLTEVWN